MHYKEGHVATFRYQSCAVLQRIYNVTGQEFPISGDAPLRMKHRLFIQEAQKRAAEITTEREKNPCDECNGTGRFYTLGYLYWEKCLTCDGTGIYRP